MSQTRRSFLRGLAALPFVANVLGTLPEPAEAIAAFQPASTGECYDMMLDLTLDGPANLGELISAEFIRQFREQMDEWIVTGDGVQA